MIAVALLSHADDELMCAGTLARLVDEGADVTLVVVNDERPDELSDSAKAIGCQVTALHLDEHLLAWSKRLVESLEPVVGWPDLLISHRCEDDNTTHGHIGRTARTIARKNHTNLWEIDQTLPGGLTSHAQPNHWVRIDPDRKREVIDAYLSVQAAYPGLCDAIEARDLANGWSIGVEAAEGFTIAKSVWL